MTVEIWNTYEMVGATVTGVLLGGVPAIAFMILKQRDGSRELAAANSAWSNALKVQEQNDRARWAPAYSPNLFAIEAAPNAADHVSGEVLHEEHPTGEIRALHADDPQVAAGLARLADEVGLVRALSDQPEHDDEDAPAEDTDRPGLAGIVAAVTVFGWRFVLRNWWRSLSWVERWEDFRQTRRERDQVGSGEALRDVLSASGYDLDPDGEALVDLEAWVAANPPTNPTYKSHRCESGEHADRDLDYRSRHTAAGFETGMFPAINASIPAQRKDGDL